MGNLANTITLAMSGKAVVFKADTTLILRLMPSMTRPEGIMCVNGWNNTSLVTVRGEIPTLKRKINVWGNTTKQDVVLDHPNTVEGFWIARFKASLAGGEYAIAEIGGFGSALNNTTQLKKDCANLCSALINAWEECLPLINAPEWAKFKKTWQV